MTELKTEEYQNVPKREAVNNISLESKLQLLFHGSLSISFVGYFALREHWIGFIFAHTAALSIMGFYGCLAGAIAKKKGYSYGRAFQIGFFVPIILGGISAFIFVPSGERSLPLTCGGWVSLATGIVVVISYFFVKKIDTTKQIESEPA
jgi:hypothetical protein